MDDRLRRAVLQALGSGSEITAAQPVGGGSINQTFRLTLGDGRSCFLKTHPSPPPAFFAEEARGLGALAAVGQIRVPEVWAVAEEFLLLEAVVPGSPGPDFSRRFGRGLAQLHGRGPGERYGFDRDNYLGLTPQPNGWSDDWCDFWRRHRLGHQRTLARQRGLIDPTLDRLIDRLADRLEEWLAEPVEPPCLIHGDLWGGNYLIAETGEPVLIDPAVYYGRREAELAMTRLFGGFDARFYAAYQEVHPLAPGSEDRLAIYELYHLLNHLNLFGRGYREPCVAILRRLV